MSDEWLRKATLAGKWLRQNWGMTATGVIINDRECMVGFWPPGEQQMKGKVCNDNAPDEWCKYCGCGNDVLRYRHLPSCTNPTREVW